MEEPRRRSRNNKEGVDLKMGIGNGKWETGYGGKMGNGEAKMKRTTKKKKRTKKRRSGRRGKARRKVTRKKSFNF